MSLTVSPSPTPAPTIRQIVAAVLTFALGFAVAAAVIHACIRDPLHLYADVRSEKLAILDAWRGKATSAAFGSSHVHNGFDPRVFDHALAGSPLQTTTINLAIEGGSQSEQRATALEYLRHLKAPPANAGPQACLVLLELNAGANFTNDHLVHPRSIDIYDWRTARFESRLTDGSMPASQRLGRIGFALAATGLHYINLGMLSNRIFTPPLDRDALDWETRDDRRGIKLMPPLASAQPRLLKLIADRPPHPTPKPQALLPGNRDLLDELARASPVKHLQFVYFVMPRLDNLSDYPIYPDSIQYAGGTAPILTLGRPDLDPELYRVQFWLDEAHLDPAGAEMVSAILANALKDWYAVHGAPQPCGE